MTLSVKQRLDEFRRQKRIQAGSLIISAFGDAVMPRGGRIWLGSLIRLLEPLQLNERLIRTSVFRLAKEEWLRTESVGRRANYVLTHSGKRRFEEASRHIYATHAPSWDRCWRLILLIGELPPRERDKLKRALFWQGFGALGNECFVHPGTDLEAVSEALATDGLGDYLGSLMPLLAGESHAGAWASHAELVTRAWDLEELGKAYTGFVATYGPIRDALGGGPRVPIEDEDAFLLRLLLIHDYRRLLLRDPELPDVLLPQDWPGQKARQLCRELYRRVAEASERHLDQVLRLADGSVPWRDPSYDRRFPEDIAEAS